MEFRNDLHGRDPVLLAAIAARKPVGRMTLGPACSGRARG